MAHPLLNSAAHLRRWAQPIVPPQPGAPLVKKTHDLEVALVWLDGSHSCDWDFGGKRLSEFLLTAMGKLVAWKQAQGYEFFYRPGLQPPPNMGWRRFAGKGFWWKGPVQAIVVGRYVMAGDPGEKDFDGTYGPWPIGLVKREGEQHLHDTGGRIAYRVGGYFTVRQHLAEVPILEGTNDN